MTNRPTSGAPTFDLSTWECIVVNSSNNPHNVTMGVYCVD
jgi:hypothetical protein